MSVSISTIKLQEAVSKAIKGVGNNKLIPLTSLMCVEVRNSEMTIITTDATNYLYVKENVNSDDFYAVIDANTFAKLISKMTCENVVLNISSMGFLEVKGNGTYKIELPLDEDGQPIKYPDPVSNLKLSGDTSAGVINRSTLQVILDTIQPALADTLEIPCYTGYYMGDTVVATDTYKIANMDLQLFGEAKLVSREFVNLASVFTEENIDVNIVDDTIVYSTKNCILYGKFMEDVEDFAIEPIMGLVNTDFESKCSVAKNELLQLLDRLLLFVGTYDKNGIYLTFTNNGLQVSSKSANGVEILDYVASENFKDYTCAVDIQMFTEEVKSIQSDVIEIYYGDDSAIKFKDGNITIIVALLEDERVEE